MIKCKRTFKYIITNIKFGSLRKYQAELPDSKFLQQNLEFAPEVRGLQLPPNPLCRTHTPKLPFSEVVLSAWNVPKQHCFRFIKHVSPPLLSPLYIQKATKIPRNKAQSSNQRTKTSFKVPDNYTQSTEGSYQNSRSKDIRHKVCNLSKNHCLPRSFATHN